MGAKTRRVAILLGGGPILAIPHWMKSRLWLGLAGASADLSFLSAEAESGDEVIADYAIMPTMNAKHRKTLEAIFATPTPTALEWRSIELLLAALGAQAVEGRGSRVRFVLNGVVGTFHRPHPRKEAKPYQVRDARTFLEQAGINP